jgi:hypothetical protein
MPAHQIPNPGRPGTIFPFVKHFQDVFSYPRDNVEGCLVSATVEEREKFASDPKARLSKAATGMLYQVLTDGG